MPRQSPPKTLFGRRLREARKTMGIAQDKLGVLIGMDESCSSARISRYETGIHEPPLATVEKIAEALHTPLPFFYCDDDALADLLLKYANFDDDQKDRLWAFVNDISDNQ